MTGGNMQPEPPQVLGPSHEKTRLQRLSPVLPPPLALFEIAVLVALVLLEYSWDSFPALTRINPHPYWIAILLLSLQYGTVSGLLAASIAIVGTVLIGMPEPDIEERYFNYLVRVWTQPVLWLLVAMLLGSFRARQIEQRDELLRQAENLRQRGTTLLDHTNNLRARCAILERRVATRETSETTHLLAALAWLGEAAPGRWAQALAASLDAGFPQSQISLYAIDGGVARLVLTHDQGDASTQASAQHPAQPLAEIAADHPLLTSIVTAGHDASVLNPGDDEALRGLGVAAVPVFASDAALDALTGNRRVIGMLKAERLAPHQIDAATTRRLGVIATYLTPALQQGLVSSVQEVGLGAAGGYSAVGRERENRLENRPLNRSGALENAIPTVRKWRVMKWLPGGRTTNALWPAGASKPEDRND